MSQSIVRASPGIVALALAHLSDGDLEVYLSADFCAPARRCPPTGPSYSRDARLRAMRLPSV
jgi:hypothetical protein